MHLARSEVGTECLVFLGLRGYHLPLRSYVSFLSGARVFKGGETVKVKQIPRNLFGDTGKKNKKESEVV